MPPTRTRRIVKRAAMALAVMVLLPVLYVASYWSAAWLSGEGILPGNIFLSMQNTVWAPLVVYESAGLPGGREIVATARMLYEGSSYPLYSLE